MSEIQYMRKPDWISWDEVQACQAQAHIVNNRHGIHMHCQDLSGEKLKEIIGDGFCYVAIDSNRVVGTCSLQYIRKVVKFGQKKKVGYLSMAGVLPEYRGGEVYFGLQKIRMRDIKEEHIDIVYFSTAENNIMVRKLNEKQGFKYVFMKASHVTNYYSVVMAKWITTPPPNEFLLKVLFLMSKVYVKLRYKPGHKKRFGI